MPVRKPLVLQFAHRSDPGRARRTNEDTSAAVELRLSDGRPVVVAAIADGIANSAAGSQASQTAVYAALTYLQQNLQRPPQHESQWFDLLSAAIYEANEAVLARSRGEPHLAGMGTTLILTAVQGRRAWVAHVGDCRAYIVQPAIRRPRILQLTADHTVVAELVDQGHLTYSEAGDHPQRHTLSRSIGSIDTPPVEGTARTLRLHERLLLCSDGLVLHVADTELARVVADASTPQQACEQLIDLANARGGRDNISAAVISLDIDANEVVKGLPIEIHS